MSEEPVFVADRAAFAYPERPPVLERLSFEVARGERVVLLGANGSGKSTLLRLLGGLAFATAGSVRAFGRDLTEAAVDSRPFGPFFRREVGILFQNSDAQLFSATVEEEIAFAPMQLGLDREAVARRVSDALALMEIDSLRGRPPQTLSAGEQKRVALASVLVTDPSVLLLDEPTAGLDPRSQSILLDLLAELHRAGRTLVTATHDLATAAEIADRALVLSEDHRLAADAPVGTVLGDRDLLLSMNLARPRRASSSEPSDRS